MVHSQLNQCDEDSFALHDLVYNTSHLTVEQEATLFQSYMNSFYSLSQPMTPMPYPGTAMCMPCWGMPSGDCQPPSSCIRPDASLECLPNIDNMNGQADSSAENSSLASHGLAMQACGVAPNSEDHCAELECDVLLKIFEDMSSEAPDQGELSSADNAIEGPGVVSMNNSGEKLAPSDADGDNVLSHQPSLAHSDSQMSEATPHANNSPVASFAAPLPMAAPVKTTGAHPNINASTTPTASTNSWLPFSTSNYPSSEPSSYDMCMGRPFMGVGPSLNMSRSASMPVGVGCSMMHGFMPINTYDMSSTFFSQGPSYIPACSPTSMMHSNTPTMTAGAMRAASLPQPTVKPASAALKIKGGVKKTAGTLTRKGSTASMGLLLGPSSPCMSGVNPMGGSMSMTFKPKAESAVIETEPADLLATNNMCQAVSWADDVSMPGPVMIM